MKIYTRAYRPFIMGGNVNGHISTEVRATDAMDVGQGIKCCLVLAPNGDTLVVEESTGAIVGDTLDSVKADIAGAQDADLSAQMKQARLDSNAADRCSPERFWQMMGKQAK